MCPLDSSLGVTAPHPPGSAPRAPAPGTRKLSAQLLTGSARLRPGPALARGGGTDPRAGTPRASVLTGCHVSGFSQGQPPGAGVAPGCRCGPRAPVWAPGTGVGPGHQHGPRGVLPGFGEWRTVLTSWSRNQAPVGIPQWCSSEDSALTADGPGPISTPLLCPAPIPLSCGSTLLLWLPLNFPHTPEGVCERVWRRG